MLGTTQFLIQTYMIIQFVILFRLKVKMKYHRILIKSSATLLIQLSNRKSSTYFFNDMLQSSRLLLLYNTPFIEKYFDNVQLNTMRKVIRFASLPSITSYIRYYRKRNIYVSFGYMYAWMFVCVLVTYHSISLFASSKCKLEY